MRVILVRHGDAKQTDGKLHGNTNDDLTSEGKAATEDLTDEIASYNPAEIITSPVKRSTQTAQILSEGLGNIPVHEADELGPWDLGDLVGKDINENQSKVSSLLNNPGTKAPNGESFRDFTSRYLPLFKKYVDYPDKNSSVIFVTHGRNILLSKAYSQSRSPKLELTNNKQSTEHSGYAIAESGKFKIMTPKSVAAGRS